MYRVGILTASDRCSAGLRSDTSGPLLAGLLPPARYCVHAYHVLPDSRPLLREMLRTLCDDQHCDLILTTGGTGFSPRDITPEATREIAERDVPGIAEAIRAHSMQKTPRAMLSRGISVLRGQTLIINLPGSPKAVQECMEVLIPAIEHGLDILQGTVMDCAAAAANEPAPL